MTEKTARRKPWIAGLLQFVLPGLGNLYCGRPARGVVIYLATAVAGFAVLFGLLWLPSRLNLLLPLLIVISVPILTIVDGVRCARKSDANYRLARYNRWYVYLLLFIAASVFSNVVVRSQTQARLFQAFNTPTSSMSPTIVAGDHVIANKGAYLFSEPKRGDLAVYEPVEPPGQVFMKRIIGLPGETIEIRDRVVYINGKKLDEPYVRFLTPESDPNIPGNNLPPKIISPDEYFLVGDNRDNSNDSRYSGPVPRARLLGTTRMIYFSWDADAHTVRWDRIGKVLQ